MKLNLCLSLVVGIATYGACPAQEPGRGKGIEKPMGDHGPFLSCTVMRKAGTKRDVVSLKGIVIRLPGAGPAAVCFDTDTLAVTSAWSGGFLDFSNTLMTNHKGTDLPAIDGVEIMTATGLGWAKDGSFADPRPDGLGPLPREWGRYNGLYASGDRTIISYMVLGCEVLETYDARGTGEETRIRRTIRIGPSGAALTLLLKDSGEAAVEVTNAPEGAVVQPDGGRMVLRIPPRPQPHVFAVEYGRVGERSGIVREEQPADPATMVAQRKSRFAAQLTAAGATGRQPAAYVVDRIGVPEKNPWNSWMRLTAFDFFADGTAAVATLNGDVWLVSGLDESLANVTWKRFATGLYEPLGLRIVDGIVHVLGRDQITRLHDRDGDSEADFYENFNNAGVVNPSYHGFAFELQTDSQGHFYYTRTGHRAESGYPGHGCVIRVSKDGKRHEVIATGLRAPNGLGVGPAGEVAVADNQGNWVPTSRIDLFRPGTGGEKPFFGYLPQHHRTVAPSDCPPPLCWIPHKLDPSSGSAVWVTGERWGPFRGSLAHTSFGRASVLMVLPDEEYRQAAVVRLPVNFDTGIMRARFHPVDGQLYVAGVGGGWQAGGPRDGGFYRVRYTGRRVYLPTGFHVEKSGVRLTFPGPLDRETATDPESYGVQQWNYRWTEAYGSLEYSVKQPEKKGRDDVEVKSVTLSEDGRSVVLELADLKPVMQMSIEMNIEAADGAVIETEVYTTINAVPR